jgi:hypothetical protein
VGGEKKRDRSLKLNTQMPSRKSAWSRFLRLALEIELTDRISSLTALGDPEYSSARMTKRKQSKRKTARNRFDALPDGRVCGKDVSCASNCLNHKLKPTVSIKADSS